MDIKAQTYKLIDDLKAVCHNYGMGNDGNEYKVITQIFLYKFLNDKFGYEIKKKDSRIASAEKWETAYSELPEDDRLDLLDSLSPDIPRLYPEHLISTLWNQQAKGDFDLIFDSTMVDIADKNIDIFSTQTTKNTKIPLFEKLTNFVTDDAQRAPFARALVDKLVNFSFEDAFAESYDFFAGVFEYVIKDYNTNGGGVYAEYYTPHAIAVIMARLLVGDRQDYLTDYQAEKKSSKVTIDNIRRILSSFFTWLEDEDYILKSPIRRIHKVKSAATIKETYSDESLEKMRDNCDSLRDLAMIDMLSSTGMRVGEMVRLNRDDIRFDERECVVFGKGDKERIVYFDARTKIHLQNYLQSRTDSEPALFVSLRSPHRRLTIGGIELRLRELGKRLDIPKVHPHKFRRTLATMAIDKGMPIEQLQHLLGHQRIDTTMHYAMVKQSNVKLAHKKYIG